MDINRILREERSIARLQARLRMADDLLAWMGEQGYTQDLYKNLFLKINQLASQQSVQGGRAKFCDCDVTGFTVHHKPGCPYYE